MSKQSSFYLDADTLDIIERVRKVKSLRSLSQALREIVREYQSQLTSNENNNEQHSEINQQPNA